MPQRIPDFAYKQLAHGLCMLIGWGVLLPVGAAMASLKKRIGAPLWFKAHIAIQVTGLSVALAGFIIATTQFERTLDKHGKLGIVVMALGLLQPLNGILRPKKPSQEGARSSARVGWEWLHKAVGWSALLLATPVIVWGIELFDRFGGVHFPDAKPALTTVYFAVGGLVLLVVLANTACTLVRGGRDGAEAKTVEVQAAPRAGSMPAVATAAQSEPASAAIAQDAI